MAILRSVPWSMIGKSGYRFSEKIMLKSKRSSGVAIRRNVVPL
jgi:hypothetical protein